MLGTGVRVVATAARAEGNMVDAPKPLDVAIPATTAFSKLHNPTAAIAYTRDGNFKLSNTVRIVTANGALLQPAITIPNTASSVTFGRDGTVSIELAAGGSQVIGQIQLARFVNPSGLQSKGQNLMKETPASGAASSVAAWRHRCWQFDARHFGSFQRERGGRNGQHRLKPNALTKSTPRPSRLWTAC
jgi:flagellar basal-body rod protein FlgG